MVNTSNLAEIGALVGDPGRANMLLALVGGQALTAAELAAVAGVTPQTASGHLAKLLDAGLLDVLRQGRRRHHRLASAEVAQMLETMLRVAAAGAARRKPVRNGPRDESLRRARTCYDHLAGRLGVGLYDALAELGGLDESPGEVRLTCTGVTILAGFGVDAARADRGGRPACRPCLDWSERRLHLAGSVGALIMARSFELGWVRRLDGARAVHVTPAGELGFRETFGLSAR